MNVLTEIFQWMKEKKLKVSLKKGEDFREMKGDFIIMKVEVGTAFTTKSWNVAAEVGENIKSKFRRNKVLLTANTPL